MEEVGRTCFMYRKKTNTYRNLVSKPVGKRSLGRPRHGWDIKIYI
jgi:hypothetical protein